MTAQRTLRIRGTAYPLVLPTLRDPRLHLAGVIVSLQVLGQVAFDFRLSIAQILVSLLTLCGAGGRDHLPAAARGHVFGLGDATEARTVIIGYPDGTRTRLHDVAANQVIAPPDLRP